MNCYEIYEHHYNDTSDINEHLPVLHAAAKKCKHITEFGVRSVVSTWAFLAAKPERVVSYDIERHPNITPAIEVAKREGIDFVFQLGDSRKIIIEKTDLLFIDTLHTYNQLTLELNRHHSFVNKYMIMHDTTTYGTTDESDSYRLEPISAGVAKTGLMTAINDFISANPLWKIKYSFTNNNGLTVLERI